MTLQWASSGSNLLKRCAAAGMWGSEDGRTVCEEGVDHDASGRASRVRQLVVDHQRLAHRQIHEDACTKEGKLQMQTAVRTHALTKSQ